MLGVLQELHPRRHILEISLYADDAKLFCHPSDGDISAIRAILEVFGQASELLVNYTKSATVMLNCDPVDATTVTTGLACPIAELPNLPGNSAHTTVSHVCPDAAPDRTSRSPTTNLESSPNGQGQPLEACQISPLRHPHTPAASILASKAELEAHGADPTRVPMGQAQKPMAGTTTLAGRVPLDHSPTEAWASRTWRSLA
jgi:hypothetical protein